MAVGGIRLFSGSSHPALAAEIAKNLGVPLGKLETKHFSCGEYYVRYGESVRGQEIFLLQTFRTNRVHDDLMELLLMIDTARQSFAKRFQVIIPRVLHNLRPLAKNGDFCSQLGSKAQFIQ